MSNTAKQAGEWYQEIATALRPRNDTVDGSWSHRFDSSGIQHGRRGHDPALQSYTEQNYKLKFEVSQAVTNRESPMVSSFLPDWSLAVSAATRRQTEI